MINAQAKGDALEKAVKAIEEHILSSFPAYNDKTFTIEWKKRVVVEGVKHEIDVWVNIDLGAGYTSRLIFECKNREEKADKNDVIILAEKIEAVQAQNGFLVAKHFTKDAEAQAKKCARLTLLTATDLLANNLDRPVGGLLALDYESEIYKITYIDVWGKGSVDAINGLDLKKAIVEIDHVQMTFMEYLEQWKEELYEQFSEWLKPEERKPDLYCLSRHEKRDFNGTLRVNEIAVKSISFRGEFKVRIILVPVISHFDISTRGRTISYASFETTRMQVAEPRVTIIPAAVPAP